MGHPLTHEPELPADERSSSPPSSGCSPDQGLCGRSEVDTALLWLITSTVMLGWWKKKKIGWVCIQKSKPLGSHHVSRSPSTANILRQLRHTCVWLGLVNGCFSSLLPATERVRGLLTVQFKVWFSQPERFHFSPYSDSEQR